MATLKLTVIEAKQLVNVSGSVKCQVQLQQDTTTTRLQSSKSVEETLNPVWTDAIFDLDLNGFDLSKTNVTIKIVAGGDPVGNVSIPVKKIKDSPDDFKSKL